MDIKELLQMKFERTLKAQEVAPIKPDNAKTLRQWLQEGMKPKDESALERFGMRSDHYVYTYIRAENTVPLTDEEKEIVSQVFPTKEERTKRKEKEKQNERNRVKDEFLTLAKDASEKNVICFDTETTGFSPANGDELLQISIVDKECNVLLDTYVKPHYRIRWDQAEETHHISPKDVRNAPYPEEIASKVKEIFDSADIFVGHNVAFDVRFIEACLHFGINKDKLLDTMKIFRADKPDSESFKLECAVKEYCPEFLEEYLSGAHDSKTDTMATMRVFMAQAGHKIPVKENIANDTLDAVDDLFERPEGPQDDYDFDI